MNFEDSFSYLFQVPSTFSADFSPILSREQISSLSNLYRSAMLVTKDDSSNWSTNFPTPSNSMPCQ